MDMSARILGYTEPLDCNLLLQIADIFSDRYPFLGITYLGESLLGRPIPQFTIGSGERELVFVGAHHGMEWITSVVLLRFLNELCELYRNDGCVYHVFPTEFCKQYTLTLIPMLNPDGVDYQIHGVAPDNPLRERLLKMNGGADFSAWQANGRGVDLNHNYDAGFEEYRQLAVQSGITAGAPTRFCGEYAESEPEVAHLCNWIRFHGKIGIILSFHTQGEEIFYQSRGKCPARSHAIARRISALSGYRLAEARGLSAYGGLTDWCIEKMDIPAFTIECGRGKNPLPLSSYFPIYTALREMLFTVGLML